MRRSLPWLVVAGEAAAAATWNAVSAGCRTHTGARRPLRFASPAATGARGAVIWGLLQPPAASSSGHFSVCQTATGRAGALFRTFGGCRLPQKRMQAASWAI